MKCSVFFALLVCLALVSRAHAQEVPQAKLIDEIGATYCEELTTRIQNLYVQLALNPGSRAVIVISGSDFYQRLKHERFLWGFIKADNFDPGMLTEIRGPARGKIRIQYWIVPKGADAPKVETGHWDFTLPSNGKPIHLFSDNENALCESGHQEQILSEYLAANPSFSGRIVIHSNGLKEFINVKRRILENFAITFRRRIKFVHKREKTELASDVEWWLIGLGTNRR